MSRVRSGDLAGAAGETVAWDLHLPAPAATPAPAVVICHGFKGFKDWGFFPWLAERLADLGIAALRFNYSHNGAGLGDEREAFTRLDLFERDRLSYRLHDLEVVTRALIDGRLASDVAVDPARLAVFGHSLGGATALLSLERLPFAAVVTLASVARVRFPEEQEEVLRRDGRLLVLNGRTGQHMPVGKVALDDIEEKGFDLDRAADHGRPWLLIHGSDDPTVPLAAADHLASVADPDTLTRLTVRGEGADHVLGSTHPFREAGPALEEAMDEMARWFDSGGFITPGD